MAPRSAFVGRSTSGPHCRDDAAGLLSPSMPSGGYRATASHCQGAAYGHCRGTLHNTHYADYPARIVYLPTSEPLTRAGTALPREAPPCPSVAGWLVVLWAVAGRGGAAGRWWSWWALRVRLGALRPLWRWCWSVLAGLPGGVAGRHLWSETRCVLCDPSSFGTIPLLTVRRPAPIMALG